MCDPILVTPLKMRPGYSQSRRENATPYSGASPLASYKEVPPPLGMKMERLSPFPLEPCHSASVFSSSYCKTKKNLSENCPGTNLESLESLNNTHPRPFHSVVWKKKKLTHKNWLSIYNIEFSRVSKPLAQSQRGRGGYSTRFIRGGSHPEP